ncbi:MAG: hypothetical protein WCJ31_19085 [Planctomycetia bacterium]
MRLSRCLALLSVLVALVGCGQQGTQLKGIQASGTATLDGEPLEMGLIVFEPEGGGESSSSQITKDGSFKLYDIKPGRYKVAVVTSMYAGMAAQGKKAAATGGDGRPVAVRDLEGTVRSVPAKTEKAETSGLVAEVKAGEPITIAIQGK